MATFSIESNGLLEKTALYYNGSQISGVKELLINLDEEGTFESIIQYEGSDKQVYTKQLFSDNLTGIKTVPPSFTEEEANNLQLFTIESDGNIDNTLVLLNEEELTGVVSILIHIKATKKETGIKSLFKRNDNFDSDVTFKSEITYRNEDDSLETEEIFI